MTASRKAPERKAPARKRASPRRRAADGGSGGVGTLSAPATGGAAHAGSKQSLLAARLSQPAGARIADLTKQLNWLPHTVRAALTRLRQQGYGVTRSKSDEGETVYRATPPAGEKKRNRATARNAAR